MSDLVHYRFSRTKTEINNIEDIYDGASYKKLMKDADHRHLSLTVNIDGVSIYKSTNYSMWPVQCIVNELPIQLRKKHLLLAGLWFGSVKPFVHTFLKPFVTHFNHLSESGFAWSKGGNTIRTYVHVLVVCADAVARCMLQGIKQFNGEYGCSWCLNPGQVVEKGRGNVRIYDSAKYEMRTHKTFISHAQQSIDSDSAFGVVYATPLLLLKGFNIVKGFPVDYMHCVLLGVTRSLTSFWFDSEHHDCIYYLGKHK